MIAELQTSVCESKEEVVRLQQAMAKQLEETNSRWDEERRTFTHRADQANKVSAGQQGHHFISLNNCIITDYTSFIFQGSITHIEWSSEHQF